ncbi:MAG: SDR family oxidoreductase [Opitutales bacterium]|jgi:dTDP-4-dehydrorhamnose reductase|nr:SDR family oxidoreductase [Opitutales bacterium]MDP4643972.1 SDR family oxidoreductase [Opitutales bacterium]MDP4777642.1 SDR family oxidoreductase [Opitutales bacterium]MDP4879544.1 SDR family oxidoreductase [Opitutales bacterium]MDP4883150.1 SDR family oxidoreductase [Opitutales bacterium]
MKILLTGATGLLGNAYAEAAIRRGHKVIALHHSQTPRVNGLHKTIQFDGSQTENLTQLCLEHWPDTIVNCAAISSPDAVDADPKLAEKVNVALPRLLAQISTHIGARLLHVSTDMVFDGHSDEAYRSTDMPFPTGLYGQTKLMAEREVLEHNPEDPVVLRIPILMGNSPSGKRSVHEKLLAAINAGERPKLFCDEIRQPCSASNVAEVLLELTERRDLHGIFHWAGAETLSRFEMGQRILRHFGFPLDSVQSVCKNDDPDFANRPSNLTFNLHPIVSKLKTKPATFEEQLEELTQIKPLNA